MKVKKTDKTIETKTSKKKETEEKGFLREAIEYIITLAIVVGVVYLLTQYVIINAKIPSSSMEETIMVNDRVFGSRLAYLKNDPERFDIVIFEYPDDPSKLFIKRVIGLPGDTVMMIDGKVYINNEAEPLRDDFCPEEPIGTFGPYVVPEGSYFVLGDNRNNSRDSRFWTNTYVTRDAIKGKAGLRYWPFNKIGMVE
ncbi:MAG: signal peptidase I [Lachnospiraceae bacterium]|nr:signal peptidase I [Candidatus Equihabitans merdae]